MVKFIIASVCEVRDACSDWKNNKCDGYDYYTIQEYEVHENGFKCLIENLKQYKTDLDYGSRNLDRCK